MRAWSSNHWTAREFPRKLYRWRPFQKGRDLGVVTGRKGLAFFKKLHSDIRILVAPVHLHIMLSSLFRVPFLPLCLANSYSPFRPWQFPLISTDCVVCPCHFFLNFFLKYPVFPLCTFITLYGNHLFYILFQYTMSS